MRLEYSLRGIQSNVGYFYRNNSQTFASLTEISPCHEQTPGYEGQVAVDTLDDLSRLEFSSQRIVIFGTRKSNCYTGLFVWRQDNRYVVVDPLEIGGNGELVFDWWIGDAGVTDFSAIASQFSNVTAVPETYFLSSVRITLATGADGTNDDLLFELLDVLGGETLFEAVLTGDLGPNSSEFLDLMIPLKFCEFSSFRLTKITGSDGVADHLALDDLSVEVDGVTVFTDRTAKSLPYHGGYSGTAKYKARCEILETGDATPISVPVAVVVPTETPIATPTQIPAPIATPTPTPTPIPAQATINFPDAGLDAAIRQALGKRTGQQIAVEDLADLTSLSANDKGISNLSGIELCSNLTTLSLFGNQISDLIPLGSLTNLTSLIGISNNQISDISPLTSLPNLTHVYLGGNKLNQESIELHVPNLKARGVVVSQ